MNLTGPHRDDFVFQVNEKNLKTYGSQGQHKTFQVALRFAQFYYLMDRTGVQPVFLLDDAYSELDKQRARHISEYLNDVGQAFITMTDFSNYEYLVNQNSDQIIYVEAGQTVGK
jgi:DNA replication and repair protein RecF